MFFAALMVAGLQLLCAMAVFAIARRRTPGGVIAATFMGVVGILMLAAVPIVFLQGVVLALFGIACVRLRARCRVFAGGAVVLTGLVFGAVGLSTLCSWSGLKERYPFESMSQRLGYETKASRHDTKDLPAFAFATSPVITAATQVRLEEAERWSSWNTRGKALRLVHATFVEQFVESPGFGVSRMPLPSPYSIERGDKRGRLPMPLDRRPDYDGTPQLNLPFAAADETAGTMSSLTAPLSELHAEARRDFLDPDGFGFFQDRDHVAGFVSHSFLHNKPWLFTGNSRRRWLTVRVELVSMLKHERPMVYVSKNLPNMTELRDAPVRELDAFEQQALTSLIEGEDLVSDVQPGQILALGSLRAMRQCLQCHEVERGTLLGAFSYEFLRDTPPPKKAEPGDDGLAALETEHTPLR